MGKIDFYVWVNFNIKLLTTIKFKLTILIVAKCLVNLRADTWIDRLRMMWMELTKVKSIDFQALL